jgi:pimeloyl-ACP methyl ester carboxylesterase
MVHGAFNELWGPNELSARWLPALLDGLWHHDASVTPDEVAICFYGDLFRLDPETLDRSDWERSRAGTAELLAGFAGEGSSGDLARTLGQAASQAAWDRTVDLVTTLSSDPAVARTARERLLALLGADTRVVVAHSLGTILAYNVLCEHPELAVDTFVTLGSPLGTDLTAEMLPPPGEDGFHRWPGSVQRWVNVAAVGDRATGSGELKPRFGPRVEDRRIDNGHRAHDPVPYLNSAATGEAVATSIAR